MPIYSFASNQDISIDSPQSNSIFNQPPRALPESSEPPEPPPVETVSSENVR